MDGRRPPLGLVVADHERSTAHRQQALQDQGAIGLVARVLTEDVLIVPDSQDADSPSRDGHVYPDHQGLGRRLGRHGQLQRVGPQRLRGHHFQRPLTLHPCPIVHDAPLERDEGPGVRLTPSEQRQTAVLAPGGEGAQQVHKGAPRDRDFPIDGRLQHGDLVGACRQALFQGHHALGLVRGRRRARKPGGRIGVKGRQIVP